MELIPILSLIILVATISTFILAVGAYILYKVRERKGVTATAAQPAAIPAELVAPAPLAVEQKVSQQERRTFEVVAPESRFTHESQRKQYYTGGQEQSRGPELKPTFVGAGPTGGESKRYQKRTDEEVRYTDSDKAAPRKKFMRYTADGYVEPGKKKEKQEDNLRWR